MAAMSSRRIILFLITLFMVGTIPLLVAQPSAVASAGLSLGFSAPLMHRSLLIVVALMGMIAALLPRDGLLLLPVSFALMLMLGGLLTLDLSHYPELRYFMLGAVLCMGLLVGIAREKLTVLMVLVIASLGFHLGGFYMGMVPEIAAPLYYLLGVMLFFGLGFAISVAFGVTLVGDHEAAWNRLKQSPRLALLRSIFH
jgi:urease accessory protein